MEIFTKENLEKARSFAIHFVITYSVLYVGQYAFDHLSFGSSNSTNVEIPQRVETATVMSYQNTEYDNDKLLFAYKRSQEIFKQVKINPKLNIYVSEPHGVGDVAYGKDEKSCLNLDCAAYYVNVFDVAVISTNSRELRQDLILKIMMHEMAHDVHFDELSVEQKIDLDKIFNPENNIFFISEYAKTNTLENFAELFSELLVYPRSTIVLTKIAPDIKKQVDWIYTNFPEVRAYVESKAQER